ncbi:MAG: RsmE family RNA methyltransferase [Desulfuromonadaceae bacterium]
MLRACVNRGGAASCIRVAQPLRLDQPLRLSTAARAALECWDPRPGEAYSLMDDARNCWRGRLTRLGPQEAEIVPFEQLNAAPESHLELVVFQALPEKERFELVLQKLTEIGVTRIVPYTCRRSTTLAERDAGQKKSHRWPEVLLRAAKQCRRGIIPELAPVLDWDAVLEEVAEADLRLMLYEKATFWTLQEAICRQNPGRVALLVGPEGGFTEEEAAAAQAHGLLPVSLGARILRTETAAILAAGIVQFVLGDLG